MKATTEERNAAVLAVLKDASEPLGPTEIARRIGQPWCVFGRYAQSSAVSPILKRIGAIRHNGGEYTSPK